MFYIFITIVGLVIGSFLNVCIFRIPEEKSIVAPPSSCDNCGTRLMPLDLVPVFSYIFLKGKCRYCGVKIPPFHVLVEILTATLFALMYSVYGISVELVAALFLTCILIVVFFIDLKYMIIPNGVVLTGIIGGMALGIYNVFNSVAFYGDRHWWSPLLGILPGAGILVLIVLIGALIYRSEEVMGCGDIKIFIPIGLFLGWKLTLLTLFISVVLAGGISVILILAKKRSRKDVIPFGPFISIATVIALLYGWNIINWYFGFL